MVLVSEISTLEILQNKLVPKESVDNQLGKSMDLSLVRNQLKKKMVKGKENRVLVSDNSKSLPIVEHLKAKSSSNVKICSNSLKRAKSLDVLIKKRKQPKKSRHSVTCQLVSQDHIVIDDDDDNDEHAKQVNTTDNTVMKLLEEECINMMEKACEATSTPKPECSKVGWRRMKEMKKTTGKSNKKRKLKVNKCKLTSKSMKDQLMQEEQASIIKTGTKPLKSKSIPVSDESIVEPSPQYEEISESEKLEYDLIIHNLIAKVNETKNLPQEFDKIFLETNQKRDETETKNNLILQYELFVLDYIKLYEFILNVGTKHYSLKNAKIVSVLNKIAPFVKKLKGILDKSNVTLEKDDIMIDKTTQTIQNNPSVEIQTDIVSPPHGFRISSNEDFNSFIKENISIQTMDFSEELTLDRQSLYENELVNVVNKRERSEDREEDEEAPVKKFKSSYFENKLTVEFESQAETSKTMDVTQVF